MSAKAGCAWQLKNPWDNDMVVQISFDDATSQSLHEVTGHIEWCNKQIDEPGYQAGVSFRGDRIIEAMGHYLGQHHDQRLTDLPSTIDAAICQKSGVCSIALPIICQSLHTAFLDCSNQKKYRNSHNRGHHEKFFITECRHHCTGIPTD